MLRHAFFFAASVPLFACSASMRRGVNTTEAATGLEQVTRSSENEFDPAVSRDGSSVAYEVAASPDALPHVGAMSLKDVGSRAPSRPAYESKDATGLEPAWMPDTSGVVFASSARGSGGLVQTIGPSIDRTAFLAKAGDPGMIASWPAISPDGRTVAMSLRKVELFRSGWRTFTPFDAALGVSDLEGSGVTILGAGTDPAWSPHGRRLAFSRTVDGRAHVFLANADGSAAQQITDGPDDDVRPTWSPDGRFIAFCSEHSETGWTQANLFVIHADGSGLIQLTEGDRVACRPAWGADGFIYFHANATDRFHIWRIRPVGDLAGPASPTPPTGGAALGLQGRTQDPSA